MHTYNLPTFATVIGCAALLSACGTTKPHSSTNSGPSTQTTTPAQGQPTASASVSGASQGSGGTSQTAPAPHLDPNNPLGQARSIYFAFDDYTLKASDAPLLEAHARYLVSAPNLSIKLEGHADERGSREYNLALGQKRADAVMRALGQYGVKGSQLEATSFGEERPKAAGNDEAAWSQNRRVDLQYGAQ